MARIIGIGVVVLGLWVSAEITRQGLHGAFGGALSAFVGKDESADRRTTPERAADAVAEAHREADERRNRLLEKVDP